MPTLVQIAIWNVNCGVGSGIPSNALKNVTGQLDPHDRYRLLKDVVAAAVATMTPVLPGTDYIRLFLAPEYLFAKSYDLHVMHPDTRAHVVADLLKLSARNPDVLMFPGTVAYCKPVVTATKDGRVKYQAVTNGHPHDPRTMLVSHNTAYGFFNGAQVFKYRKIENASEVSHNESIGGRLVFAGGTGPGSFAFVSPHTAAPLNIGVEVCADHAAGHLSHAGTNLDLHLILSASTVFLPGHSAVRVGGVVCHADDSNAPAAYQNIGGLMTPLGAGVVGSTVHPVAQMDMSTNAKVAPKLPAIESGFRRAAVQRFMPMPGPPGPGLPSPRANAIRNFTANYIPIASGKLGVFETTI